MWFGQANIFHMGHFVHGVGQAMEAISGVRLLRAWFPWVQQQYLVVGSVWGWERILLYTHESPDGAYRSHAKAISALPGLFEHYFASLRDLGEEGIERLLHSRMAEERGALHWVPDPDPTLREWERWTRGDPEFGSPHRSEGAE